MQLRKIDEVENFITLVQKSKGNVWLETLEGDRYNLKSTFSRYLALGELISKQGNNLMLFCSDKADEAMFFAFFEKNPDTL